MSLTRVHVKFKHIRDGVPMDPRRCAVALALNEATGQRWVVITPHFYRVDHELHFKFNDDIIEWIVTSDKTAEEDRESLPELTFMFDPDDDLIHAHTITEPT